MTCKYGNDKQECTSSPMDCQCALDAVFTQREWVGLTQDQRKALLDARNDAMEWAAKGRIPECGAFAGIAQNLDWLCDQLLEKNLG